MAGIENKEHDHDVTEKPEAIKKQEDIAKKYPDLNAKEKWVLTGLDIGFDKERGMTPDEINKGMNARFDAEISKVWNSGQTLEITEAKRQLSEKIEKTTDMKEKIALFQEFLNSLEAKTGTLVAEQNQRAKQNADAMKQDGNKDREQKNDLGELLKKANEQEASRQKEQKLKINASEKREQEDVKQWMKKAVENPSLLDWPPESKQA